MGQPEVFLQANEALFDEDGNLGAVSRVLLQAWIDRDVLWLKRLAV